MGYVATTLARFPDITCALVGIGGWARRRRTVRRCVRRCPAPLVGQLDAAGAVADIRSTVLDADGAVVGGDAVPARCIAITTEQLRAVPDVVGLAGGADKATAIAAVLAPNSCTGSSPTQRCGSVRIH